MNFLPELFRGSSSIRQRLFWRLGILSLGTLSVVNLIWLPSSIREIRQSQAELQRVAVRSVGDQIELFLDERERQLKSQAVLFSAPFAEGNQEAVRLLAHRFLQRDPAFEEIGIVDREGKERFRLSRKLVITDRELQDLSAAPFYQEGMRGKLFWGSVFTTETSEPWVTVAVPLRASETTIIGVAFGVLSLKSLWDLTGEFRLTHGGRAYIVEQTGRVIAAGDSSVVLRQLSFADRPLIQQLTQPGRSAAYSFVQGVYVNENNVSVTATGLLLPGTRWAVVVEQSQALLYGPVRQKLWLSLAISLIGLLVSFGVARSLSSRLSGPIIRLREGVKLIGHGQLEHRVVVEGADEVGQLAAHFNTMAESLEEREAARKQAEEQTQRQLQRIAGLREINLATTSTLDLHAVLKLLMDKIDLILPYSATTVRLFNQESRLLEPIACRNLDEEEWRAEQWKGGHGIPSVVFEKKASQTVRNVQTDARVPDPEFFRKHGLVSYLGVPLIVKDEILGVLSFYTKEEHEFAREEVEFLSVLANQAAIAIHNSRLFEETKASKDSQEAANQQLSKLLDEMSRLYAALTPLDPSGSLREMLDKVSERLIAATGADAALVRLQERASGAFTFYGQRGFPVRYMERVPTVQPGSALHYVFTRGEPIISADIAADPRLKGKVQLEVGFRSCAMLPLKVGMEVRGIVHLASREVGYFTEEKGEHLMAIARQMGIAVENRELFDELRASKIELEKASKVKDEFLGFISHELKTPVNSVVGYAAMMQDRILGEINEQQEMALGKVVTRSKELLGMINSLLEATKVGAGAVKLKMVEVALGNFLDELRSGYNVPLDKEMTLIWDYPPDLPAIMIDGEKLKRILENLINNAIKYTDRGNVRISARYLDGVGARAGSGQQPGDHGHVEFKVADTGIGIPKEEAPFIFEMFRQVEGSQKRSSGGVGLGLHIVKKFTELLGGQIEVESEPDKGSTFTVTIPCGNSWSEDKGKSNNEVYL